MVTQESRVGVGATHAFGYEPPCVLSKACADVEEAATASPLRTVLEVGEQSRARWVLWETRDEKVKALDALVHVLLGLDSLPH
jgi:hypothetical protein